MSVFTSALFFQPRGWLFFWMCVFFFFFQAYFSSVFRQDNQPCDIMEQSQTVTISCVSSCKTSHPISLVWAPSGRLLRSPSSLPSLICSHDLALRSSRAQVRATVIRTLTPARTTGTVCRRASRALATTPTSSSFPTTSGKVGAHLPAVSQQAFTWKCVNVEFIIHIKYKMSCM